MALAPSWLLVSYSSWTLNKVLLCYSHQKCGQLYPQDGEVEGSEAVMVGLRTARNAA